MTFNMDDHIPTDQLMAIAWRDALLWASNEDEILKAFSESTGFHWQPASNPIDMLVDQAIDMPAKFSERFIPWFNENIWGDLKIKAGK